jgi:hypothetical protein
MHGVMEEAELKQETEDKPPESDLEKRTGW